VTGNRQPDDNRVCSTPVTERTRRHRAPDGYDIGAYPPFAVTVDVVVLTVVKRDLHVLLIRRDQEPYRGDWALPGGFKRPDETLLDAAARELAEEAGIVAPGRLMQFGAYGDPGRDPRGNVVSIAFLAVGPDVPDVVAGSDAADARLWRVTEVVTDQITLAFDHHRIVLDALDVAADRLQSSDLATAFVGPEFTLSALRSVYEAVWGESLDAANFRRSMALESPDAYAKPSGFVASPGPEGGRPPELYRATETWSSGSPVRRPRRRGTDPAADRADRTR
jgi:8-oxo-dGTP diphosphatase